MMDDCFKCPRGYSKCAPLAQIESDDSGSFFCVGYNDGSERVVDSDRFTVCFKNSAIDEEGHWDRRDIIDQLAVFTQALSIDANIQAAHELSEKELNEEAFCYYTNPPSWGQ